MKLVQPLRIWSRINSHQSSHRCASERQRKTLKVEYAAGEIDAANLVVTVTAEVPTGGFEDVKLVRVTYKTPPKDGIQDYILLGVRPTSVVAQVISQVKATDTWDWTKEAPWITGIRVHGIDDGVVVKMFTKPEERPRKAEQVHADRPFTRD